MSFQNAGRFIQRFVDNYGNLGRTYGVFDFVRRTSEENTRVELNPNNFLFGEGRVRSVQINYFPIQCDVEGDCDTNICDTGTVIEPKQRMFDITQCTASKIFSVRKNDIRYVDNNNWDFTTTARNVIFSAMPEFRRLLATQMTTYLYGLSGLHPDGNPEKRIVVTNTATGVINPAGKVFIETEYDDAGFSQPNIYGGYEVKLWQEMQRIGGLNAQGQNVDQQSTADTWYDNGLSDKILNDLTNGGHILTIAPEMFKFVWYLENAGIFSTDLNSLDDVSLLYSRGSDSFLEGTLIDPVTGFPMDLYINYDKCTQMWHIQFKFHWDFFVMPDVVCAGQNVNGIMRWRTCPQVLPACPTGSPLSPAQAETTFSWTPNLANIPDDIYASVIAGVEVTQNTPVTVTTLNQLAAYMSDNSQIQFRVNGSDIEYDGYTAISGTFNNSVAFSFS